MKKLFNLIVTETNKIASKHGHRFSPTNLSNEPSDDIAPENVRVSWAYQRLVDGMRAGQIQISSKMRGDVLNIGLGNHPYIVRKQQKQRRV